MYSASATTTSICSAGDTSDMHILWLLPDISRNYHILRLLFKPTTTVRKMLTEKHLLATVACHCENVLANSVHLMNSWYICYVTSWRLVGVWAVGDFGCGWRPPKIAQSCSDALALLQRYGNQKIPILSTI